MYYFSILEVLDLYVMFIWYEHISIVCFLLSNQENKYSVLQNKHVPDLIMHCFIFLSSYFLSRFRIFISKKNIFFLIFPPLNISPKVGNNHEKKTQT